MKTIRKTAKLIPLKSHKQGLSIVTYIFLKDELRDDVVLVSKTNNSPYISLTFLESKQLNPNDSLEVRDSSRTIETEELLKNSLEVLGFSCTVMMLSKRRSHAQKSLKIPDFSFQLGPFSLHKIPGESLESPEF